METLLNFMYIPVKNCCQHGLFTSSILSFLIHTKLEVYSDNFVTLIRTHNTKLIFEQLSVALFFISPIVLEIESYESCITFYSTSISIPIFIT